MRRRISVITLAAMLCALLSGCLPWSAEDSYKLPRAPKDYENLMLAVAETRQDLAEGYSAAVEDVPPVAGDNTSTVQMLDMDSDGSLETAATFFRIAGADMSVCICLYTLQEDGSYQLTHLVEGEGDGVYAVHYVDMDGARDPQTGETGKEIVVSWQMGSSTHYLGVYALEPGQLQAQARLMTTYDTYQLVDMDRDGLMELVVGHVDPVLKNGNVELYDWSETGVLAEYQVDLSTGITEISRMRANYLTDFTPAFYISGGLVDTGRITDVIALRDGVLTNLSLDPETGISRERVEAARELAASDVNNDYILEIARPWRLPSYGGVNSLWLADWVQYSGDGQTGTACTTYHNVPDGWYLVIPEHWKDQLLIYRNDSVSGQRAVVFALWQGEKTEPLPFLSIYKLTGANRSLRASLGERFVLAEDSNAIYAATFYNTWDCGLDQSGVLENFRLIVSSWSGD